ncbi:ABC transporter ATP-binding protein [Deinococcus sp. KNUC1210]|uniref:ABC transporter ATP-binding protein n=1 Tax=Deinococcus sp. KNUC1210 TaxID=2917691 RepID=UPI001EF0D61A|nr:ABC transporter ATP-binding protein [Deinococcus sp. KNUC1210]ULH16565.1 ABC transporter ATP-binding protein [Deinococcus sp. KNUC1210]
MITLEHLEKRYGESYAVRDLNITFPDGAITALLGPSGCGKTTTLRMINRLIEPSGGRIVLNGKDTSSLQPEELRRGIGYVIQQIGLFPHLSVAQNVATVPDLLGRPRAQTLARVDELLSLVGLEPNRFRDKRPGELSGGQAQRVGVARALAADPPVLLMDEPFGALDPLARDEVQERFLNIQKALKKTVVIVSHDIDEALRMGDYVALMQTGQLAQFGTPDDLVKRPASEFVRKFLGDDANLRQLAGVPVREFARAGDAAGLPRIEGDTNTRTALALMLRAGNEHAAIWDGEKLLGVVGFEDLALNSHTREPA